MSNNFYDFSDDDDDENKEAWEPKFDECFQCRNKWNFSICSDCSVGEWFEEEDPDEVDKDFIL